MPTECQQRDVALRAWIRARIDAGKFPLVLSRTISVGFGSGLECLGCRRPIEREHIEYHAFGVSYGTAIRLHWGCHVLWQLECIERMRPQAAVQTRGSHEERKGESQERRLPGDLARWAGEPHSWVRGVQPRFR
jgi:hypothetical protein